MTLLADLEADPALCARLWQELQAKLREREIFFGDGLLPTFLLPYLVEQSELAAWHRDCEALAATVEKVAQAALRDPRLFAELGLQPAAHELLRIDPGYSRVTVLARPDAVVGAGPLKILEFNCDSPAMMSFCDAVGDCLLELDHLAPLRSRLSAGGMTDALLDTLLDCYREYGGSGTPTIAITDWAGQKTRFEHQRIRRAFEARGVPTLVCDPREFRRREGLLEVDGRPVQLVYRRALFTEILERQSEIEPLLSAYRDGRVCMVNSLRSYVASSKTLMAHLCRAGSPHLAHTRLLDAETIESLRAPPRRHVIKRGESHGGLHVLLPELADEAAWQAALDSASGEPWVAQDYIELPRLAVLGRSGGREDKYFNWNPFLFGGRCAGSMARASDTPLINITLGGGLLPTIGTSGSGI